MVEPHDLHEGLLLALLGVEGILEDHTTFTPFCQLEALIYTAYAYTSSTGLEDLSVLLAGWRVVAVDVLQQLLRVLVLAARQGSLQGLNLRLDGGHLRATARCCKPPPLLLLRNRRL